MTPLQTLTQAMDALTTSELLQLLENIVQQIRIKNELALMAQDPEIQAAITAIQADFAPTEQDGLAE
ncbi:MAG: hypothetical protein HC918_11590 [Oscillatoriales cyanobacterium SM2_1_8]|nr:hypothetical protein [Oscillatoriales cyanobacterium SM2_1_8]